MRVWHRLGQRIRQDAVALLAPPWRAVRAGRLDRFWLGPAAAIAVLILSEVAGTPTGQAVLRPWAGLRGGEAWWPTPRKGPPAPVAPPGLARREHLVGRATGAVVALASMLVHRHQRRAVTAT